MLHVAARSVEALQRLLLGAACEIPHLLELRTVPAAGSSAATTRTSCSFGWCGGGCGRWTGWMAVSAARTPTATPITARPRALRAGSSSSSSGRHAIARPRCPEFNGCSVSQLSRALFLACHGKTERSNTPSRKHLTIQMLAGIQLAGTTDKTLAAAQ